MRFKALTTITLALLATTTPAIVGAQKEKSPPPGGDIPAKFVPANASFDFDRREVDIPMRDGVTLHAVIVQRKGLTDAPILLQRTPFNAESVASRSSSPSGAMNLRA